MDKELEEQLAALDRYRKDSWGNFIHQLQEAAAGRMSFEAVQASIDAEFTEREAICGRVVAALFAR